jgi:hypothetical protein
MARAPSLDVTRGQTLLAPTRMQASRLTADIRGASAVGVRVKSSGSARARGCEVHTPPTGYMLDSTPFSCLTPGVTRARRA